MVYCCVVGCQNNSKPKHPGGITFHRFPKDKKLQQAWLTAVGRADWKDREIKRWDVVCSAHFKEKDMDRTSLSCVRLRENVVPCSFPTFPSYLQPKLTEPRIPPSSRCLPPVNSESSENQQNERPPENQQNMTQTENQHCTSDIPVEVAAQEPCGQSLPSLAKQHTLVTRESPEMRTLRNRLAKSKFYLKAARKKIKSLRQSNSRLSKKNELLKIIIKEMEDKERTVAVDHNYVRDVEGCKKPESTDGVARPTVNGVPISYFLIPVTVGDGGHLLNANPVVSK